MAEAALGFEAMTCVICVELLKEPTTLPCGHSFCMDCIQSIWNQQTSSSCPKCTETFSPRPVLCQNTVLDKIIAAPAADCEEQQGDGSESAPKTQANAPSQDRELQRLRQEAQDINSSAQRAVQCTRDIYRETALFLEKLSSEVEQQIHSEQETQLRRVRELQDRLQQDCTELALTQDHAQSTLQSCIQTGPGMDFEDVSWAVLALEEKLQATLREFKLSKQDQDQNRVSLILGPKQDPIPSPGKVLQSALEPSSRADLLRYSKIITMDTNTHNWWLHVYPGNRKISSLTAPYRQPDHPQRFKCLQQVLSSEGLTGCCYFEVEEFIWEYGGLDVALSYRDIRRDDWSDECLFGYNDKSWALRCEVNSYTFICNKVHTQIQAPVGKRIGIYLDHDAGVLSFHRVQGKDTSLLHRVPTRFTQPLYVGARMWGHGCHILFVNPSIKESLIPKCIVS